MVYVLHETKPKARKPHQCDTCFRAIAIGETYLRQDNVHDGQRYTWMNCAHCDQLIRALIKVDPDANSWDEGIDVAEWVGDCAADFFARGEDLRLYFYRQWCASGQETPVSLERLAELLAPKPHDTGATK